MFCFTLTIHQGPDCKTTSARHWQHSRLKGLGKRCNLMELTDENTSSLDLSTGDKRKKWWIEENHKVELRKEANMKEVRERKSRMEAEVGEKKWAPKVWRNLPMLSRQDLSNLFLKSSTLTSLMWIWSTDHQRGILSKELQVRWKEDMLSYSLKAVCGTTRISMP